MGFVGHVDPAEDVEPGRGRGPAVGRCGHQASFLRTGRPALDEAPAATLREGIHSGPRPYQRSHTSCDPR